MSDSATRDIGRVLELSRSMLLLAEQGEQGCTESSCSLLYGALRDSAFKLRQLAERAGQHHQLSRSKQPELKKRNSN